jgi:hypothetical protein
MLFHGVPFSYIAADEGMLPAESIRFFQVDQNWIYALIEGAVSIARSSTSDEAHDAVMAPRLHAAAGRHTAQIRKARAANFAADHITGFLLRSAVVAGWPGLEVVPYDDAGNVLQILRMDLLGPGLLFCLVAGVLDHVDLNEPPEGLHFGVDILGGKMMRYVTVPSNAPAGTQAGDPLRTSPSVPVTDRGNGCIKIGDLAAALQAGLEQNNANNDPATGNSRQFTTAEFSLEMVEGAQSVRFVNGFRQLQPAVAD